MFSSSKKAKNSKKKEGRPDNDMMNMFGMGMDMDDDDDNDEDLEAELAALQGRPVQKKKPQKKDEKLMSLDQITQLAADSMKDIPDDDDDDDDIDDEDLLAELHELVPGEGEQEAHVEPKQAASPKSASQDTGVALVISQRIEMYKQAHENAKAEGASSKVRRLERGMKELDKLLKNAKAGRSVNEDDIPPPVAVKRKAAAPTTSPEPPPQQSPEKPPQQQSPEKPPQQQSVQPSTPKPVEESIDAPRAQEEVAKPDVEGDNNATLQMLQTRQNQYKQAALAKKRDGDIAAAKHLLGIAKQFGPVIAAIESGQSVDLSGLPPPPGEAQASPPKPSTPATAPVEAPSQAAAAPTAAPSSAAPSAPGSVLEALQQRLEKYQQTSEQAKADGNGSKARRMGRIAKQYQDAIRDHKRGKAVNFEELPTPPGFAAIPGTETAESSDASTDQPMAAAQQSAPAVSVVPPQAADKPPQVEMRAGSAELSRNQKELQFLQQRQKEFKMAALQAKKNGDMETAKYNLRQAKGMDEMIVAAQSGLRVDITTVPSLKRKEKKPAIIAPEDDFEHVQSVTVADETSALGEDTVQLYTRLENALMKQIKTSEDNAQHYRLLGDLSAAKNFDTLRRGSQQDLDTLIMSKSHRHAVPKFHYEMKSFPIVRSHPELSDSELEINIIRCINVPLPSGYQPKDMYTYINYEFPFPSDDPQTGSSNVVKGTINPEFEQSFKVLIDRKNRALARVLRRQPLNFKVMYQRGFLKSDKALGQANIKLEHFNNKSTIHECVELMDTDRGRRAVGGKIEVMLKLRQPLVDKDVEVVNERWLVLDSHIRSLEIESSSSVKKSPTPQRAAATSNQYKSLEVAKFEKDVAEKQIAAVKAQGKSVPSSLLQKVEDSQEQIREAQAILKQGGETALNYMKQLKSGMEIEKAKAQKCLQTGDKSEAKLCLARKKLLEREHSVMMDQLLSYQFGGRGC